MEIKNKSRVDNLGEVFTPESTVNKMLDLDGIREESYKIESKFLEPSCGNGNFLVKILERKISSININTMEDDELDVTILKAISNIYGIDIMLDNINESKLRLLNIIDNFYTKCNRVLKDNIRLCIKYILDRNIIFGDSLMNIMYSNINTQNSIKNNNVKFEANGANTKELEFSEWEFNGEYITRKASLAASLNRDFPYRMTRYDLIYTLKDMDIELEL